MPGRDPIKAKARWKRYAERRKVAKYGPGAAGQDMRGRHGNHARGERAGRWNHAERLITSHGYVAVRVVPDHPHAWGVGRMTKYAYEHILVAEAFLGRSLQGNEIVHHKNGNKQDNRPENLEVMTVASHAQEHCERRGRDELGRFPPNPSLEVPR